MNIQNIDIEDPKIEASAEMFPTFIPQDELIYEF